MGRSALTVGISTYSYYGLKNLEAPARDAEAIAQQLEVSFSPFQVERLPGVKDKINDGLKTGKSSQVTLRQLQEALVRYFKPRGTTYSDTSLFYFSGHGLYDDLTGKSYLATSDTNPEDNKWGYALTDLSALLRDSPVKRQIIWLDCCHSGGLIAVKDANPGEQSGYSRCFVAASQEIESAYELTSGSYSVLTDSLLQGLNPERVPGEWVDTLSLCAFVNQYLKNIRKTYPQRSLFLNVGEPIDLTYIKAGSASLEGLNELQVDVCPYRALNAFDFTPEDVKVFFGRTALTDELLAQIYEYNFLAVLGPSGSGKSSVVRAGLLYELQQGKRRSGTEVWHILLIIRPGESPLRNLAGVFIPEILRTKKKGEALLSSSLSDLKARGADALVDLVKEDYEQPVVLVVDQFEEIFTLCRGSQEKEQERKDFLDCLFGAVDTLAGQFRLVITLRADFLGKCLEQSYGNLAGRIKDCRIDITPLTDSELDEVINKPAATGGLQVAPYLQERLKEHIKEAPGSLPLLEYALTELWRDWHTRYISDDANVSNQLTFESYDRIGGVAGALEKQANAVYESFAESTVKQGLVQRIFLELVQPGEETEDTRRQVLKRELISEIHPEAMLDEVLGKLVEARLVVTDEVPTGNDLSVVVIELAHEATIRHWQQLRYWLNNHRQDLPLIREIRKAAKLWQANKSNKYLLTGIRLEQALNCVERYRELGFFSFEAQDFVRVSHETWIEDETEKEKQILEALYMAAEVQWNQQQQLESLTIIAKAGERVRRLRDERPEILPDNVSKVQAKLQETLYNRIQEKQRLEGHSNKVNAAVYSPDGKTLASASQDNTVKLWNTEDGSLLFTLEGHSDSVNAVVYSPDGKTLASASQDNTVKLWNTEDGSLLYTLKGHSNWVNAVVYSPDGKTLASASYDGTIWVTLGGAPVSASRDNTVKLWNTEDGSLLYTLEGHSNWVNAVVYSPDGKTLASASRDNTVKLWNTEDGSLRSTLEGHSDAVITVVYSPDGQTLASASHDNTVKLWNATDGNLRSTLEGHGKHVRTVVYSPDGQTLASASYDKTVKLWNATDGSLRSTLEGHSDAVITVVYSSDGKTLASASHDNTVKLWNAADGNLRSTLEGHSDAVITVVYSPDGQTLASASSDNTVKLWNIADGSLLYTLEGHSAWVRDVAYSPDGQTLASASDDKTIKLWNTTDGSLRSTLESHSDLIIAVAYSLDGQTLASASHDKTLKLWNLVDGSLLQTLEGHSAWVRDLAYSPDGQTLASASHDKTIKLWNAADGTLRLTLESHSDRVKTVVYSPDGQTLASALGDATTALGDATTNKTIKLWNATDGSLRLTIEAHRSVIGAIAYSPDGQTLASASWDETVKLWNPVDGSLLQALKGHSSLVNAVAYSPDGQTLASASSDKTIKLWNVRHEGLDLDSLLTTACKWLAGYLRHNPNVSASDKKLLDGCSESKFKQF